MNGQENLELYNTWRGPPKEALKEIKAGRLKGMTDINPQWRIQALTERFGPVGVGWNYEITKQWTEPAPNGEVAAFCNILFYYRDGEAWSGGIPGTGGSKFVANEKNGPYASDECYKMAPTDAISVACKALGLAADVYWDNSPSKYGSPPAPQEPPPGGMACADCGQPIKGVKTKDRTLTALQVEEISLRNYGRSLCTACQKKAKGAQDAGQAG